MPAESLNLIKEKQNAHAVKSIFGESIKDVKFSPDGSKIVSCGVDQTIKVWDLSPWSPTNHRLFSLGFQRRIVYYYWVLDRIEWVLPKEVIHKILGYI